MSAEKLAVYDIVQISSGSRIIITGFNPTRPANKYRGVLENGQGKEYIFGDKHRPVFVGTASERHPAVMAAENRTVTRAEAMAAQAGVKVMAADAKAKFEHLVDLSERTLNLLEADGYDTGVGGILSDLRDAITEARAELAA